MLRFLLLHLFPLLAAHVVPAQTPARRVASASVVPMAGRAQVRSVQSAGAHRFRLPQVLLPDAAVAARVNQQLAANFAENLENQTGQSAARAVQQAQAEYEATDKRGFTDASYEVLYNAHNLLSAALHYEFTGAYSSMTTRRVTFNLLTGQLLTVGQLVPDTLALRRYWRAAISRAVGATVAELPTHPNMKDEERKSIEQQLGWNARLKKVDFAPGQPQFNEFALTAKGLEVYHRFGFPHVMQALEPDGTTLIPYATLKPWLKSGGLLGFHK